MAGDAQTLSTVVHGFGQTASAHGIQHIYKARGILKKLIWILCLLGCTGGLGLNLYTLITYYTGYPVTTKILLYQNRSLPFPAVTVCNTNPIKSSKAVQNPRVKALIESWGVVINESLHYDRKKREADTTTTTYASCEEAFVAGSTSTGVKIFHSNSTDFKAFCIFNTDRTGWVYLSTEAVLSNELDLAKHYSYQDQVRVRIFFLDGRQKDSTLQQITEYANRNLTYVINVAPGFESPSNFALYSSPYLYVGFLDKTSASVVGSKQGWRADGKDITYTHCGGVGNNYFTFYPTTTYSAPPYGLGSYWDTANTWRGQLQTLGEVDQFSLEYHFGGCGVIEVSNDWSSKAVAPIQASSAALGLKFYMSDECSLNPCGLHGTCRDKVNTFSCGCEPGWEGIHCDQEMGVESRVTWATETVSQSMRSFTENDVNIATTESSETHTESVTDRTDDFVSSSALPETMPDILQGLVPGRFDLDKAGTFLFDEFINPKINLSEAGIRDDFSKRSRLLQILQELTDDQKKDMGYTLSDMIMFCEYVDHVCTEEDFQWFFDAVHGNCYVFNSDWNNSTNQFVATRTGKRNGLRMVLDIGQYEYIPKIGDAAGAVIVVHPNSQMPFPEDEGIVAKPGRDVAVAITAVEGQRLPDPYGENDCNNEIEPNLTRNVFSELYGVRYGLNACYKTCYQRHVVRICECADPQYPIKGLALGNNSVICDVHDESQESCRINVGEMFVNNSLECDCEVPCHEIKYRYTATALTWPSESYEKPFVNLLQVKYPQLTFFDLSAFRRNVVYIEIFFETFHYESLQEYPAYVLSRLFTDIGGIIGLWVGCGMFSVVELFTLFSDLVSTCCHRWRRKQCRRKLASIEVNCVDAESHEKTGNREIRNINTVLMQTNSQQEEACADSMDEREVRGKQKGKTRRIHVKQHSTPF